MINELSQGGITVFVTTHYLDEAEFCNRIVMIDAGKIIAVGSPAQLKANYLKNAILEIECEPVDKAINILDKIEWINNTAYFGQYLHLTLSDKDEVKGDVEARIKNIWKLLTDSGIIVHRIDRIAPSLEDVFVNLLEKYKA